ncbi:hypothetical protein RP20_CCG009344 [Aedes albopictus]|nr:hypothetical protein RP20_CCG009344 [Aedes albopictus]
MRLVIVLSVVVAALAAPEGYHYDPPAVSSTLYFPSVPSYVPEVEDCVEPEAHGQVQFHHELPSYSHVQQPSHVYQAPVKTTVIQPLKTQVTYEKQQVQSYQQQQASSGSWKEQQQQSWGWAGQGSLSSSQSSGSAVFGSGSHSQSSYYVQPQRAVEEVYKHVYVHVPPEDKEEYEAPRVIQPVSHKQKHYKIIFIKAPSPPAPKSVVVPPQASSEEKTIVYVLHQKPEHQQEVIVQKPEPAKQNKPEVFFIKYKNRKEEHKQVKYVAPVVASTSSAKSVKVVDTGSAGYSSGSSGYSAGSSGSSYSYVSSTSAPVSYSTASSKNTAASYSYVSSTPAPTVEYSGLGDIGTGYSYVSSTSAPAVEYVGSSGSSLGSTGSSYSSFTNGAGAGYESYVDLGNSGYSSFSSGASLGVINVGSSHDYQFVPSTTLAPVVKVTSPVASYVSSTPHSVVSSTIGSVGDVSVKNPGLSGYSSRTSGSHGHVSTTTVAPVKKTCRRCASTTSSSLKVQDAYVSNVY